MFWQAAAPKRSPATTHPWRARLRRAVDLAIAFATLEDAPAGRPGGRPAAGHPDAPRADHPHRRPLPAAARRPPPPPAGPGARRRAAAPRARPRPASPLHHPARPAARKAARGHAGLGYPGVAPAAVVTTSRRRTREVQRTLREASRRHHSP